MTETKPRRPGDRSESLPTARGNPVAREGVYVVVFPNRHAGTQLDPGFEAFVLDRSAALLRTAFLLIGDRGDAEDLLRTALLRTALKWRNAREHPEA